MYHAIVFLPLVGFLLAGLFGRVLGPRPSEIVTTALLFVSAALSWYAFVTFGFGTSAEPGSGPVVQRIQIAQWLASGDLVVDWAFRIDTLTVVMLVVVNTVSALVHLYSVGYMHEDPHRPRFFAYLSLFTFAMLMLVTADNLVQMFFGWEGVGLASYLLIGFWYHKESANAAAIKAFIVNRVGDFGFALGICLVFVLFDSVAFDQIFPRVAELASRAVPLPRLRMARAHARVPAALHGRHGKVGSVPPAHLAARCHGGTDARVRPHPRGHHGHGGRVHGGAALAALRIRSGGALRRDRRRRR